MTGRSLWVYLATSPLLWLTLTVVLWVASRAVSERLHNHPLSNPVLLTVLATATLLLITDTPYPTYFAGAQFVHFLLGPATVALGVHLHSRWNEVRSRAVPMLCALGVGSVTAVASTLLISRMFGLSELATISLAPKSATAGIAMAISEGQGGDPALTASLVIATGLVGALLVTPLMNLMRVTDYAARGFAVGLTSHGIGTARALSVDATAGLFAGVAMALNAIVTSVVVPIMLSAFRAH